MIKQKIISLLCATALCISASACAKNEKNAATSEFQPILSHTTENASGEFETVAENGELCLLYRPDTTDIRCMVKKSGYVWGTDQKQKNDRSVYAPFSILFTDSKGVSGEKSAYTDSVARGQYKAEATENGIKIQYTLGDVHKEYLYPIAISPGRYDMFYELCDDNSREVLSIAYEKRYFDDYDDNIRAEMEKKYPNAEDGCICTLRNENMNDSLKSELTAAFAAAGYANADKADDIIVENKTDSSVPIFNVTMYYELDGGDLLVRIPQSEIEMSEGSKLSSINVLECFKGTEEADGYFLLPDGSGSVMNYKNGRESASDYRVPLYKAEDTLSATSKVLDLQNAALNVYGCRENRNAYLAVIEDGNARAFVNAVSGSGDKTPRVWPSFTVCVSDAMRLASSVQVENDMSMSLTQTKRYDGDMLLRIHFFGDGNADYNAMADWYRQYLLGDRPELSNTEMPINVELVCELKQKNSFLGFPYKENELLTSVGQAEEIADSLSTLTSRRVNLKLSGWCNGGYENGNIAGGIKYEKAVGTENELKKLASKLKSRGSALYLDADVQYAYKESQPFGIISDKNTAHLLSGARAEISNYDLAVYSADKKNGVRYVLSPAGIGKSIDALAKAGLGTGAGISLRNIGTNINADYGKGKSVDRQDAIKLIEKQLAGVKKDGLSVMTSGANNYVLPFADSITDAPLCSDGYDMCDYSVPFAAMVMSGKIEYASSPINLSNSEPRDILRIIENGAAPFYVLTAELCRNSLAQKCGRLYASRYESQKESIKKTVSILSETSYLYGHRLIKYERLTDGVFRSTFDNGSITLNYNDSAVNIDGTEIGAYGFVTEGGENG